jgi:phosphatidylserine/phosphatidylglycerophosphate/cardiolipin synthase-like enzyme
MPSPQTLLFRSGHKVAGAFVAGAALAWTMASQYGSPKVEGVCVSQQISVQEAFSPSQGATPLVVATINQAKQSVLVAAYSFTSRPIAKTLISAHQRGVEVRVVMDDGASKSHSVAQELADGGVPVRLNDRYAIMHNKFIVIDGTTLETGSFNFTNAAEKNNAENVLVIHDQPTLTAAYIRQWHKLWDEGVDVR